MTSIENNTFNTKAGGRDILMTFYFQNKIPLVGHTCDGYEIPKVLLSFLPVDLFLPVTRSSEITGLLLKGSFSVFGN